MNQPKDLFLSALRQNLKQKEFIKLNLGHYVGTEDDLKKILVSNVLIKKKEKLSFVYRYRTKDITKNYTHEKGISIVENLISNNSFRHANLFALQNNFELLIDPKGNWKLKQKTTSVSNIPDLNHDHNKHRKIRAQGKQYLHDLKITDAEGNVRPHGQDKYKQINHYIDILSTLLKELPQRPCTNIVDMGSGKGYLTFALYDYLNNVLKNKAHVTGVEFRKDLVDLCNAIASKSKFDLLEFVEGSIQDFQNENAMHVLIALHACDTATDDAIYKGIQGQADLIVVAPCCHKQIRRAIRKGKRMNEMNFLTKHGIFLERQAEMVTDGLRALFLEFMGYSTKIIEFISTTHTPKNVLIVAQKRKQPLNNQQDILKEIKTTKEFFGIHKHHLEALLDLSES